MIKLQTTLSRSSQDMNGLRPLTSCLIFQIILPLKKYQEHKFSMLNLECIQILLNNLNKDMNEIGMIMLYDLTTLIKI